MMFDEFQLRDLSGCLEYLSTFWKRQAQTRANGPVSPRALHPRMQPIRDESLPIEPQPLSNVLADIDNWVLPNIVKTSHPLFLAYVTPPSLDICALGDTVAAVLNQNVSFENLSPAGTAIETTVIRWLGELIGYGRDAGGIMLGGGSIANLYGLALGRRMLLGGHTSTAGNYLDSRRQRIYCSEHAHRSIQKAAALLGIGSDNVVSIQADKDHRIRTDLLEDQIKLDRSDPDHGFVPTTIVGAAGTRVACAFDDLAALADIAERHQLWFHVDAAYGGFLRLATPRIAALDQLHLAHSVTLDPHKLLFVPFDAACLLVQDRQDLLRTFGTEGEYLERSHPPGADFADLGMQLGRSMKALKVWLALKYVGVQRYGEEMTRLLGLAQYLRALVEKDANLELLAPVIGTAVCFRWRTRHPYTKLDIDAINKAIRTSLQRDGSAYIDEVFISGHSGMRVCLTNYRTDQSHLEDLISRVGLCAEHIL